ncbi:hypothetical protein GIB67_026283 [Kingdonia uniflora]|uniref:C2H2-type domain-containing protein n=1 Tax=Kingdonia uniflora TaxID=39325 RepID=A0A7J7L9W2_9MAGN|nr:hypothetical protein GIB67_026283 [Kingdonia uniflora]
MMRRKTPKKPIKITQEERLKSVEESTTLLVESNNLVTKQLEVMLAKVCSVYGFGGDGRFADAIENEVEIGEKKIVEKARLGAEVVTEDSKKFVGDGLEMKQLGETTEREVHHAIDLVGGKDGDMSESSRSKDNDEVVTLMPGVHMINDSNHQEAQPKRSTPIQNHCREFDKQWEEQNSLPLTKERSLVTIGDSGLGREEPSAKEIEETRESFEQGVHRSNELVDSSAKSSVVKNRFYIIIIPEEEERKMDLEQKFCPQTWTNCSLRNESSKSSIPDHEPFTHLDAQQLNHNCVNPSVLNRNIKTDQTFFKFNHPSESLNCRPHIPDNQIKIPDQVDGQKDEMVVDAGRLCDWDPQTTLSNLSFLEQKIHQLRDLVQFLAGQEGPIVLGQTNEFMAQQQQLISVGLTSILAQLISTAGSLLPSENNPPKAENSFAGQQASISKVGHPTSISENSLLQQNYGVKPDHPISSNDDHETKDEEEIGEGENLIPGSYEVLQLEKEEILAPHTHFCLICGKGFKRDANLRMHMRGHGDEYKTPAALAKPNKEISSAEPVLIKRYSCPYAGCKRNKDHKKFQPLKTILCVKNHYKRTHCDKSYICSRCNTKKFSVIADLKTHEKHCGREKWLCSCGTTFSRKDKLFGHVALFQGHSPALPVDESKELSSTMGRVERTQNMEFNFSSGDMEQTRNGIDIKVGFDDATACFSPFNFDAGNFGGFHEFPRPPFDSSENSLSFLLSGSSDYIQNTGDR